MVSQAARCLLILFLAAATAAAQETTGFPAGAEQRIEFNRDIRPILSDNCYFCHGPDQNHREADLRLDTKEGLLNAEHSVVVPGKPAESRLLQRVESEDPDSVMPPPDSGKSLTAEQTALLRRWIDQGGEFQGHWSFLAVNRKLRTAPDAGPQAAAAVIDQLVQQQRETHGLTIAPPADPITRFRRLSLDLTGLPPNAEEVTAFAADPSPQAWEQAVDSMLQSPHFGERMAVWWLDLVRYADSVGYHGDQEVSISPFRDYVIESFNSNKRFDQFTREQLAGDLMPDADQKLLIASGYNRLGMMSAEGGVQPKEYLAKYIAERVRNASGTWLGITLGCAECHDHKFDPLTTQDFYRFEAFFADIREKGLYSGGGPADRWGPSIRVPTTDQKQQLAVLDHQIAELQASYDADSSALLEELAEWEKSWVPWTVLKPQSAAARGETKLTIHEDGSVLASGPNPATESYTLTFHSLPGKTTAFRIDVLPHDSLPQRGPGRAGNGNFVLSEFQVRIQGPDEQPPVLLQNATASYEQTGAAGANPYGKWAVAAAIDADAKGPAWGWAIMEQVGKPHYAIFETAADLTIPEGASLSITLEQNLDNPGHNIGHFRISAATSPRPVTGATTPPAEIAAILAGPAADRSADQQRELLHWYRTVSVVLQPVRAQLADLQNQRTQLQNSLTLTLVTETVEPRMIRILPRGNWMDESGEVVQPAIPAVFGGKPAAEGRLTRLDLADWIVSEDNPLTARVTVNRIWKMLFGEGLSRRLDDLGAQGEWPTHPALLDFLAAEFQAGGWDFHKLIRSIVLSATYQQSSVADAQLQATDPYNMWLARQGRFRIDAEFIRDSVLSITGLLEDEVGGPSVRPYQPAGYWAYLNFPTRTWTADTGSSLYRRGIYTHWQRQYLHPALLAFDAPGREECTAQRSRSNTPLQALVLMNAPEYVEAARVLADEMLGIDSADDRQKLDLLYLRALSRPPSEAEMAILLDLLERHRKEYAANADAARELLSVGEFPTQHQDRAAELAAWTSVTRTILNLHEVVTRN